MALTGAGLAIACAFSALVLADSLRHERGSIILWSGLTTVTLLFLASTCLFLSLYEFFRERTRGAKKKSDVNAAEDHIAKYSNADRVSQPIVQPVGIDGEYVATYSWPDRAKALIIAGLFGILTVFLLLRSTDWRGIALSGTFFGISIIYVLHLLGTSVRFTREGFIARLSWLRQFDAPYNLVNRVSSKPGTLKIEFSDGRSLKIHSGLGNPDVVIALLQARCPESIHLE